jgi:hypothetical protein
VFRFSSRISVYTVLYVCEACVVMRELSHIVALKNREKSRQSSKIYDFLG